MKRTVGSGRKSATKAIGAHMTIEPIGRPEKPPPPPPNRIRLRRRKSSRFGPTPASGSAPMRLRRLGESPHGPPPSGGGSSAPPLDPHGPLVSANSPRARAPHPKNMLMDVTIGTARNEKQWQ